VCCDAHFSLSAHPSPLQLLPFICVYFAVTLQFALKLACSLERVFAFEFARPLRMSVHSHVALAHRFVDYRKDAWVQNARAKHASATLRSIIDVVSLAPPPLPELAPGIGFSGRCGTSSGRKCCVSVNPASSRNAQRAGCRNGI
jgi:hypothetical protein